jgi:formamidopyrimidine-DNA glycosylase
VRAWLALEDGRAVVLDDPRALGRITFHAAGEEAMLFQRLGPEPFSKEFTLDHFIAAAGRSSKPIKLLLMEQRAVVGLGNIYVAEALFQAGIHPARASSGISRKRLARLHGAIGAVLALAMGSAEAAYEKPGGFSEAEVYPVAVYGREGKECPHCKGCVKRIPQGGRSTYYCPKCQK